MEVTGDKVVQVPLIWSKYNSFNVRITLRNDY